MMLYSINRTEKTTGNRFLFFLSNTYVYHLNVLLKVDKSSCSYTILWF